MGSITRKEAYWHTYLHKIACETVRQEETVNIRQMTEERENAALSEFATRSTQTRGRTREEQPCDIRTEFQRDRDRIIHCKSFRRLKHKTQVFLAPEGDHYRERMTHTLEVAQIARTIAKALQLNEDLTEAIALGHDLGHTPFGHAGERLLNELLMEIGRDFKHNEQSVRVVEKLENAGRGLNLTWEVLDGIRNHGTQCHPATLEGQVVRISDKIAYINHDIDDAIRAGVLNEADLPRAYTNVLGTSVHNRLNNIIHDVIMSSLGKPEIVQSPDVSEAMFGLRRFMFEHVYSNEVVKGEEKKAQEMLRMLFDYYMKNWETLPNEYIELCMQENEAHEIMVSDYIAGMTDFYATKRFEELFVPSGWKK